MSGAEEVNRVQKQEIGSRVKRKNGFGVIWTIQIRLVRIGITV